MKKKLKLLFIVIVILGIGYLTYTIVLQPSVFNSPDTLVEDYLTNLNDTTVCTTHFNSETVDLCTTFQDSLSSEEITITNLASSGDIVVVQLTIDSTTSEFTFTMKELDTGGIRGFVHSNKYLIDTIE